MTDLSATAFFRQTGGVEQSYFHGTRYPFKPGDLIEPGRKSNQGYGEPNDRVFFTHRSDIAHHFAESADDPEGHEGARPRVYQVEPTGPHEMDTDELPEDAKAAGSRQSRHPLRVVQEHDSTYVPEHDNEFEHDGCEECGEAMTKEPHCAHCGYGHHTACCEEEGSGHRTASTRGVTAFFQRAAAKGKDFDWPTAQHYLAETTFTKNHKHQPYAHIGEAQDHADRIAEAEGISSPRIVDRRGGGGSVYWHSGQYGDSGPEIGLTPGHMHEAALIHEMTHHFRHETGQSEGHDAAFSRNYGAMLWDHHSRGGDARAEFSHYHQAADKHMRANPEHYQAPPDAGPDKTTAALLQQAAEQPQEWYHGSGASFDRFDLDKNKTVQDDDDAKHWNSHLGAHFTSDHRVAQEFAQRQGGGHVYHAQLNLKNPKHYDSEHDLDKEAVHWAHDNGHDMGPSFRNPAYRAQTEPDEWQFHIKYGDDGNPRPDAREIAHGFRDHLKSQGHDGITYGNEFEGAHNGFHADEKHTSAIAFHPDQVKITQRHGGNDDHGSPRTAGRGKPRSQPRADQGAAGEGKDADGAARAVGAAEGGTGAVAPRAVSFHPAAHKEMSKLDAASRKRVAATVDTLAQGGEGLQTHALTGPLKGWRSTKATRGHRVLHRDLDDGTLHIGYVGLHNYDKAINRLTGFFRQAADGDTPQGTLVRGMNVSLDPAKHDFIHDTRQPLPSRAHLLLSELHKQTPDIDNETLKGGTGGLGEFWTRNKGVSDDAAAYQHENRAPGEKSTTVTLHAHEPSGEHFWHEMAEGPDYPGNYRVPLRPGAPVGVHAITWGEPGGHQHHYDFSHTVDKHAALSATAHFRNPVPKRAAFQQALFAEAAAVDNSSGVMVALSPPPEIAAQLVYEGGQSADDLHVTLAYLGKKSDYTKEQLAALPEIVSSWAARQKPVTVRTGGVLKFSNAAEDQHVLCASIDMPGGAQLHSDLARYLEGHGYNLPSEHGWNPHMTLKYVDKHFRFMPHVPELQWQAVMVETHIGGTCHQTRLGTIPNGRTSF